MTHPNRYVWVALAAAVLLALGLAPALAQDATDEPPVEFTPEPVAEGPVTTVNGESVPAALFQARVRLTRFLYAYTMRETLDALLQRGVETESAFRAVQSFFGDEFRMLLVNDLLGDRVLDTLERDVLLRQVAAERGVTVDDAAIDAQIDAFLDRPRALVEGAAPPAAEATEEATAEPEAAEDRMADFYAEAERRAGVSREAVRDFFAGQALRDRLLEAELGPFPNEWPVVTVRHILVATEDEAADVLAQLEAGADFAELAADVSIDTATAGQGGALGTTVAETFVGPFADAVRDAPVGEIVGPVETQFGYHIIEVTDRKTQPPDAAASQALTRARTVEFQTWLHEQVAGAEVERENDWPAMIPVRPVGQELLREMLTEAGR